MNSRNPLLLCRQRSRFLLAQVILFLPEALDAAALTVIVCGGWRGGAEEKGLLFDAIGEELLRSGGWVGAGKEFVGGMSGRSCHRYFVLCAPIQDLRLLDNFERCLYPSQVEGLGVLSYTLCSSFIGADLLLT